MTQQAAAAGTELDALTSGALVARSWWWSPRGSPCNIPPRLILGPPRWLTATPTVVSATHGMADGQLRHRRPHTTQSSEPKWTLGLLIRTDNNPKLLRETKNTKPTHATSDIFLAVFFSSQKCFTRNHLQPRTVSRESIEHGILSEHSFSRRQESPAWWSCKPGWSPRRGTDGLFPLPLFSSGSVCDHHHGQALVIPTQPWKFTENCLNLISKRQMLWKRQCRQNRSVVSQEEEGEERGVRRVDGASALHP